MAKRNDVVELIIDEVGFPNKGEGTYEGDRVKFKGGIKGQKVRVRLGRKRKATYEAKVLEIVERSPLETELGCAHFGTCGGCTYQGLTYEEELKLKENQVRRLFEKEGLDINLLGIEASPTIDAYRNKMEFSFGDEEKDGPLALGLHMKNRFYEVVNTVDCNIADRDFNMIRENIKNYFQENNKMFYNKRLHEGFLRHLVIRKAKTTGEILINLVTSSQDTFDYEDFKAEILASKLEGSIVGLIHTINDSLGDVVKEDRSILLFGRNFIVEEILGLKFEISPYSFFQTNTLGAEKLYSLVRDFAGDINNKVVFDLYSGTGTIAQIMAPVAKKVIGIEIVEEAVEKAKENAKLNGLDNVEFIAGDVLKAVDDLDIKPDLIVIDPPRDGIHPKAINKIIDFNPQVFVYVSCNPTTLARDLKVFEERGYKVEKAKLMDMFPRTGNVECITLLTK